MKYYSYDEIDRTGCNYRIVIGERSDGKTYGFKLKALENYFTNKKQFAYVRRSVEEIKLKRTSQYFADMDDVLKKYRDRFFPQYDYIYITAEQGKFNLYAAIVETAVKEFIGTIGFYFSLTQSRYDKTVSYPDVTLICWDEFLTNAGEHEHELTTFLNLISTIKRKRNNMIVYMIGNTVTRNSLVLADMGIDIRKLKQGEIRCFSYESKMTKDVINTVAVEWTKHFEQSKESESFFVFDSPRTMMITHGTFEVDQFPTFDYNEIKGYPEFGIFITVGNIKLYTYVYDNEILISDERLPFKTLFFMLGDIETRYDRKQFNINGMSAPTRRLLRLIIRYYSNGKVRFNNNYAGDDFVTVLNSHKLKRG